MRGPFGVIQHVHCRQSFFYPGTDFRPGDPDVFQPESHIFLHNGRHDLVVRVLEYHPHCLAHRPEVFFYGGIQAAHQTMSAGRGQETVEMTGQGGLAAAVGPDNGDKFAGGNGQVDALERSHFLILPIHIGMGQIFRFNDWFHNFLHKVKL